MGLFLKKNITEGLILGIWEINEAIEELMKEIRLSENEISLLKKMKFESRKQQWIASRKLINDLLGNAQEIAYTDSGKPYLIDCPYKISLSHAGKFVAAIVNKKEETGIDIERISSRIDRLKYKFLNERELDSLSETFPDEHLHVLWGAKEALYKLYGNKELLFKTNLLIDPFEYSEKGIISGTISSTAFNKSFRLQYEKTSDYMLVFVLNN